jgi:hypothetical protein
LIASHHIIVLWTYSMKMQFCFSFTMVYPLAAFCSIALCGSAIAQEGQAKDAMKGLPPRTAPTDYHAQAKAGGFTFAADFDGHGVPAGESVFSTEDYIVVEIGIYGAPGSHLNLTYKDFSLRINGRKGLVSAQPYESVFHSLKDPDWIPPDTGSKSKGSIGGGDNSNEPPPAPVKMPMPMQLSMEQKVAKASLPEGDRPVPEAGLLFFQNGGKISGFNSIDLVYSGAAGRATLKLVP